MNAKKEKDYISLEDHFLPEIIDPQTGRVLPREEGELVFTTLTKEGTPIVHRTGDISSLNYEPCSCGRTLVRMKKSFSLAPMICSSLEE